MKEEPVDPRMEKLVASLYGELPEAEERELRELLKRDPALKAEWDELVSMRSMLGEWEVEERVPSFVMVDPEPVRRASPVGGFVERWRERFGGFFAVSGWAVAAAAVVLLVFTMKGYRLERIDGGLAFRTAPRGGVTEAPLPGGELAGQTASGPSTAITGVKSVGREAAPGGEAAQVVPSPRRSGDDAGSPVQLVGGPYVTRKELEDRSFVMLRTFAQLMKEDRARHDAETASILRNIYGNLNDRQTTDYQELRGRIEAVGLGLMAEQSRTNERLELMQQTVADSLQLEKKSPDENGGDNK